jgi:hypothetical protein
LFCSARLAREASVSQTRMQIAAIPRAEMINATHQWSGIEEKTLVSEFMGCQAEQNRMPKEYLAICT